MRCEKERVMYFVNSYFTVAIYLAVIASVMIAILRRHETVAANRRLLRMMVSCGIDGETAANANQLLNLNIGVLRDRCRNCTVTDLCDHWFDHEGVESNSFCPNVWHYAAAAGSDRP